MTECWGAWADAALGLVYPDACQLCDEERATAAEGYVCGRCWERPDGVRFITPPYCDRCGLPYEGSITTEFRCSNCADMDLAFVSARAAVIATPVILDVIHRYKYNGALWFEPFLAELLLRQVIPAIATMQPDWVVPVPLHTAKQREREFNQAEHLARRVSAACGIPCRTDLVIRNGNTRTQTHLTREDRARNVRNAFAHVQRVRARSVLLVDDVLTTGATTSACAEALLRSGHEQVFVWTVARGLRA